MGQIPIKMVCPNELRAGWLGGRFWSGSRILANATIFASVRVSDGGFVRESSTHLRNSQSRPTQKTGIAISGSVFVAVTSRHHAARVLYLRYRYNSVTLFPSAPASRVLAGSASSTSYRLGSSRHCITGICLLPRRDQQPRFLSQFTRWAIRCPTLIRRTSWGTTKSGNKSPQSLRRLLSHDER